MIDIEIEEPEAGAETRQYYPRLMRHKRTRKIVLITAPQTGTAIYSHASPDEFGEFSALWSTDHESEWEDFAGTITLKNTGG